MKERLIWRPNSIDPAEWERMSREEQIQWWKSHETPRGSPHPLKAIERYEEGTSTEDGLMFDVFDHLTESNISEFMAGCPSPIIQLLIDLSARFPFEEDERGWQSMARVELGCHAPWVTPEEIKQGIEQRSRQFRNGLRVFRIALEETR